MLWPEGPPHRLRDLDEPFVAFAVSKPGYYLAACTAEKIAMYRIKPLAPVSVYTLNTTDQLPLEGIRTSSLGNKLVAWTASEVITFNVIPVGEVEELAQITQVVAPGPGEAMGTRELYLAESSRHAILHDIIDVVCFEDDIFAVGSEQYSELGAEIETYSWSRFQGIKLPLVRAVAAPLLDKIALISDIGSVYVASLTCPEEAVEVCSSDAVCVAFNMRLGKLAVATVTTVFLYCLDRADHEIIDYPHGLPDVTCMQWSAQGNALVVGSTERWTLLSALGMPIFASNPELSSGETSDGGISHAEWSLASDELLLLGSNGLYVYNILRWTGLGSLSRPVLFNSSRLQIFHDGQKTRLSANPWLIVPLPAFYVAENWPLLYVSCSPDGKYVSAAGSTGLMYFSVLSRNWKELPDRDMRVRGGVVWYGRVLIVAIDGDSEHKLQMYSPVSASMRRNSSIAVPTTQGGEEEQVIAKALLESRVIAMSLCEDLLAVFVQSATLKIFDLSGNQLVLVDEWRLNGVVTAPGRVRSIDLLSKERVLVFVDDQLISLNKKEQGVYRKQVLADSVEYYSVEHGNLWLFDGHELSLHDLSFSQAPAADPNIAQLKIDADGIYFKVDGYPVAINPPKGVIATIEAHNLASKDGSFSYVKPTAHIQVYLLHLLQNHLDQLHKYAHLDYYDQVLQSLLNRALVNDVQLPKMVEIVKRTAKSWRHVVASCARKVEMSYWPRLFGEIGESPAQLFDEALEGGDLGTAAEFLMVVHADKSEDSSVAAGGLATQRLFKAAFSAGKHQLCQEVCEFLLAVDETGGELARFQQQL